MSNRNPQRGISMVVTLLMLLALTLIGVAALNNNNLQFKMATNSVESNLSFQNAETGLVFAEKYLEQLQIQPTALDTYTTNVPGTAAWKPQALISSGTCTPSPCPQLYTKIAWWENDGDARSYSMDYSDAGAASAAANRIVGGTYASTAPRYIVEEIGPDTNSSIVTGQSRTYRVWYYRITSQGYGGQQQSATITQSIYARPFTNN